MGQSLGRLRICMETAGTCGLSVRGYFWEVMDMLNNLDYSLLFQQMLGTSANSAGLGGNMVKMSDISSPSVQAQLKAAGIDTNSMQYQTVVKSMMEAGNGGGYFSISGLKNRMRHYDSDGDYICPVTGLSGLLVTDENRAQKNRIIAIPESSRDEMFELTKREFLRENGVGNGDTTRRSDVYLNLYRRTPKNDRLAAGHTLEQYERAYTQAFVDAVKAVDPKWEPGRQIPSGALEGITREAVDSSLVKSGSSLVRRADVAGHSSGNSFDRQV